MIKPAWHALNDNLLDQLSELTFSPPVAAIYNPLVYAREPYEDYWQKYALLPGREPSRLIILGMNPGPYGMAQTGVPFGEIAAARDWLGISGHIGQPEAEHPKRPILGWECKRSEVSGARVWGWARERYGTPESFFRECFVINYCPLVFMEESGANRTPDKLKKAERDRLFTICDAALRQALELVPARAILALGRFAAQRATDALRDSNIPIVEVSHPSPANPRANKGWSSLMDQAINSLVVASPAH